MLNGGAAVCLMERSYDFQWRWNCDEKWRVAVMFNSFDGDDMLNGGVAVALNESWPPRTNLILQKTCIFILVRPDSEQKDI